MASSAAQIRSYEGPALFSYGFRPFFLFGAGWAALVVAIWLPLLAGTFSLPTLFSPIDWHVPELVYGYVPAIVAGFLLTAVPNWTGRLPVVGPRLQLLFGLWLVGRLAILLSRWLGPIAAGAVDLLFLLTLGAVIAREVVAAGNTRNLKVLAGVALLLAGNALFHVGASTSLGTGLGERLGIAASIFLIMLIGGRIIPSFTRNWLAQRQAGRLPVPFGKPDMAAVGLSSGSLAAWVAGPERAETAALAIAACLANALRLARWHGHRTVAEPLVLILHIAYAFVPIGYGLLALAILAPGAVTASGAVHGWTAGAIALMTLAVMTRASLGHTGRPLRATKAIAFIYAAAIVAALARILVAFGVAREPLLHVSAIAWVVAFAGFVAVYAPLLLRARS